MSHPPDSGFVQSVRARLRNEAEATGRPFAETVELYVVERFLHRLGLSSHRDALVLKGAQLLRHWVGADSRPTRDIDLSGASDLDADRIRDQLTDIFTLETEHDAVDFDPGTLTVRPIRNESAVLGLRAKLDASLGRMKIRCQIDVGLGDSVFPAPQPLQIEGLLDLPVASVRAYTPYSSIAEKLEAIVVLGMANSRMKDYYDLTVLPRRLSFRGEILAESVRRTFERRSIPIPRGVPDGLSRAFGEKEPSVTQWRAFLRKSRLTDLPLDFHLVVSEVGRFLIPVMEAARDPSSDPGTWPPGGPWTG